jgi:hypothetical protein
MLIGRAAENGARAEKTEESCEAPENENESLRCEIGVP